MHTTLRFSRVSVALLLWGCTSGGERPSDEGLGGAPAAGVETPLGLPFALTQYYVPTGFMGDGVQGEALLLDTNCRLDSPPAVQGACFRFRYEPEKSKPVGWAGLYFQSEPDNWGSSPGHAIERGARRVSFTAASNRDVWVKFLVGGIGTASTPYEDDFTQSADFEVTPIFREFEIDVSRVSYERVLGGFGFVVQKSAAGAGQLTLYLTDVVWH